MERLFEGGEEVSGGRRDGFAQRIEQALHPIIEAEVEERLCRRVAQTNSGVAVERALRERNAEYDRLLEKYVMLEEEMARARETFEQQKREWQGIRHAPSLGDTPKTRPGSLHARHGSIYSRDQSQNDGLFALAPDVQSISPVPTGARDRPTAAATPTSTSTPVGTPARFKEAVRCKASRRALHATECTCCSRVGGGAGVTSNGG